MEQPLQNIRKIKFLTFQRSLLRAQGVTSLHLMLLFEFEFYSYMKFSLQLSDCYGHRIFSHSKSRHFKFEIFNLKSAYVVKFCLRDSISS